MELLPETYGQAHQMTITLGPDVNAEELGHWYSPARVAILIEAEREACALLVDHILREGGGTYGDMIRERPNVEVRGCATTKLTDGEKTT